MALFLSVLLLQGVLLFGDELFFHRKRGLGSWERIGHPLDALTLATALGVTWALPPAGPGPWIFGVSAVISCLSVTKDEAVHARECQPLEQWLHACLFLLHATVLVSAYFTWLQVGNRSWYLGVGALGALASGGLQILLWNTLWRHHRPAQRRTP